MLFVCVLFTHVVPVHYACKSHPASVLKHHYYSPWRCGRHVCSPSGACRREKNDTTIQRDACEPEDRTQGSPVVCRHCSGMQNTVTAYLKALRPYVPSVMNDPVIWALGMCCPSQHPAGYSIFVGYVPCLSGRTMRQLGSNLETTSLCRQM